MRALKAMPSFQLVVKLVILTLGYLRGKKTARETSLTEELLF